MPSSKKKKRKLRPIISVGIFFAVAIIIAAVCYGFFKEETIPIAYESLVEKYAAEYSLDESLIFAVIKTESSFNPDAVSSAPAHGLMQITPDTFKWLKTKTGEKHDPEELFNPEISIKYGAFFLNMLIEEFEITETALAAYNAGRGQVNIWLKNPEYSDDGKTLKYIPFPETRYYVQKVTAAVELYEKAYKLSEKTSQKINTTQEEETSWTSKNQ